MADLYIKLLNQTQESADEESAKVYDWLVDQIGNKGLHHDTFDCIAFIAHEITNNRLLRNSLTREIRLRVVRSTNEVVLSIRYDGEPFNDLATDGSDVPRAIQRLIEHAQAQYGPDIANEGNTTGSAGETLYTTARINFPIQESK